MAWNQTTSTPKKAPTRQGLSSSVKGILALIVVCALGGLVWWFVSSSPVEKEKKARTGGEIAEVKPALSGRSQVESRAGSQSLHRDISNVPLTGVGSKVTNVYGTVYTVKHVSRPGVRIEKGVEIDDRPLFEHSSLNDLDALYRTTPGFRIYGTFNEEEFNRDFVDAVLKESISIGPDDSEDVAHRKQMVAEGVAQLKALVRGGGNPGEIVREARKELSKMADFKDNMISVVLEMKESGCSSQEIEDYYESANKLLQEQDIPPILSPATVKSRLEAFKMTQQGIQQ